MTIIMKMMIMIGDNDNDDENDDESDDANDDYDDNHHDDGDDDDDDDDDGDDDKDDDDDCVSVGGQVPSEFTLYTQAKLTWNEAHVQCQQVNMTLASLGKDSTNYIKALSAASWFGHTV
nr:hypothetical protein BaRGS_032027 [Batillaria attramentaria]